MCVFVGVFFINSEVGKQMQTEYCTELSLVATDLTKMKPGP